MEPITDDAPLIAIVGQTGSGKSALALELARQFGGEIICADSRTIYKGMDIGTAKPTKEDQTLVPHHLLDVTTPDRPLTVADFKDRAEEAIRDIQARGKIPFLVGGTGLYIDAVIFGFTFRPRSNLKERQHLSSMSVVELQEEIGRLKLQLPENALNPRHLMRTIETMGAQSSRSRLRPNTHILGLTAQDGFDGRLLSRIESMFEHGLEQEIRGLVNQFGWKCKALQTIGYQEFQPYLSAQCTLEELKAAILRNTKQYAKRQKTWFKRNRNIIWICKKEEAVDLITSLLNK